MKNRSRSNTLLIELLLVIFFFMFRSYSGTGIRECQAQEQDSARNQCLHDGRGKYRGGSVQHRRS